MTTQPATKPECCPEFDPIPWDDKFFEWENKKFIKDSVLTIFYMPMYLTGFAFQTMHQCGRWMYILQLTGNCLVKKTSALAGNSTARCTRDLLMKRENGQRIL